MPVPSAITDLSTTLASNSPAGSDNVFPDLDNYLRAHAQFVALLRDGRGLSTEVSLASASTCDIGGAASMFVQITGTTTITSFGTNYQPRVLRFAAALTLTHNASTLILPTGANITTAAGDTCLVVPVGTSGWRVLQYQRASEGADFVSFLQAGTGATSRTVQSKLRDVVSVKDFGAVGDGSDATAAFAAALAAHDNIYVPAGTYSITGITMSNKKVLFGDGEESVLNCSGTIDFTDARKGGLRYLRINLTSASTTLVRLQKGGGVGSFELYFEDVNFVGNIANASTVGIHITDSYINTFVNCLFIDFDKAIIHGVEANRNNYFGCSIRARTTYGTTLIEQTAGQANSFVGCDIENCNQMLVLSGGSIFFADGCYFEAHNASFGFDLTGGHVGISHSYFNETFLRVQSGGSLELSKNWIKASSLSNASYPVIRLQSGYSALILDNNIRQGATFLCRMNPTRYDYVQVYDTGTSTWVNEYPSTNQLSINDVIYDVDSASTYQIRLDNARQSRSRSSIYTEGRVRFDAGSNGVQLMSSAWNYNPLRLGNYYLWVDATGDLRIKNGAPTSDTDGTVVGTQT